MAPSDDESPGRPPESGRLSPENLIEVTTGDFVRVITDETDTEVPRADHGIGDGDLYCVVQVAYRRATPDVYVKPVEEPGMWPADDAASYVIVSMDYGVTLAKEGPKELEAVQPVDGLRKVASQ